jgi:hypothetical protein
LPAANITNVQASTGAAVVGRLTNNHISNQSLIALFIYRLIGRNTI